MGDWGLLHLLFLNRRTSCIWIWKPLAISASISRNPNAMLLWSSYYSGDIVIISNLMSGTETRRQSLEEMGSGAIPLVGEYG